MVINQYPSVRIGPKFEEMNPTSLPDLLKPLRDLNLREKIEKSKKYKLQKLRKDKKIPNMSLFNPFLKLLKGPL